MSVYRTRVGPKGQITLPKELRDRYHLREGEEVLVVPGSDGVVVKHPPSGLRGWLRGKLDGEGMERDVEELRRQWRL